MIVELSWQAVTGTAIIGTLLCKIIHGLVSSALEKRDTRITGLCEDIDYSITERNKLIGAIKLTQKTLFDKFDAALKELNVYKLHVAETYVNEAKLEKLLAPIHRQLEAIESDLRSKK